jgi:hypothetical protein
MARRTAALALLLVACCGPAAAAPRRALLQSGNPCGGTPSANPNKRGIRLALTPDAAMAYGARHVTIASIDLNDPAYNGDEAAAAKMIRRKCRFAPLKPKLATTALVDWKVDDWKTAASSKTYVMTITNPRVRGRRRLSLHGGAGTQ